MNTAATSRSTVLPWLMWLLGLAAYVVAVMQRTSFGIAGVAAGDRFAAGASIVSLFAVVQMLTYAGMQIPAGVLVDRFGSRLIIGAGAVLMFLGQLDLAFSDTVVSAIIARLLVGTGDAMTFTSVLRLLPFWFSASRAPLLTQLTGQVGQLGQLLSALPFAWLLATRGWTPAFAIAASASAVMAVVIFVVLRNAPRGTPVETSSRGVSVRRQVSNAMQVAGTWLGFFIQWCCAMWQHVFSIMWGYPFLQHGLGYSRGTASALFSVLVIGGFVVGPVMGGLSRRHPLQRTNLAISSVALVALAWMAVLLWPGRAPVWLLVILMIGIAIASPGSVVSIDVARSTNPGRQLGTATGVVVVGAILPALLAIWLIGVVLDLRGGYSLLNFKWAFATQYLVLAIGLVGAYTARRYARRHDIARGVRYRPLVSALRSPHPAPTAETPRLSLPVDDDRSVVVTLVLPSSGGHLVALDVLEPDHEPTADFWHHRVGDYLALVASPLNQVTSLQIWCADAATAAEVSTLITAELAGRGADLDREVTFR